MLAIAWLAAGAAAVSGWRRVRYRAAAKWEEPVAAFCERSGGAVLKAGQILATRADLLPAGLITALSRLQEQVAPSDSDAIRDTIERSFRRPLTEVFDAFDVVPLGCGSVAQVHAARLCGTGERVAVKIKRPGIDVAFRADVAVLRACAAALGRALPKLPFDDALLELSEALLGQIDFDQERRAHQCVWQLLRNDPGVVVPLLKPELCTGDVLVMQLVEPLERLTGHPGATAQTAVRAGLRALYRMIFDEGVFHCDLHAGNVFMDARGRAVMLDLGCTGRLVPRDRALFREFFLSIALNRGVYAATILRDSALYVPPTLDIHAFEHDVSRVVAAFAAQPAGRFGVPRFVASVFSVQKRHGIWASGAFSLAILSLLIFEGLVAHTSPELDFQAEAVSVLAGPGISLG